MNISELIKKRRELFEEINEIDNQISKIKDDIKLYEIYQEADDFYVPIKIENNDITCLVYSGSYTFISISNYQRRNFNFDKVSTDGGVLKNLINKIQECLKLINNTTSSMMEK